MTTLNSAPPVAEMGTLLRELNHRIANQFASAIELISIEAVRADGPEAKAVLGNAVELLHGHAGLHRALLMPPQRTLLDAGTYIAKLCRAFRGAILNRLDIQLALQGDRLPLQPERCWRLGLIIHELVTNATSHACSDGDSGQIKIRLARADGLIKCVVSANRSAATRARHGQGMRIVRDLVRTLGGRIEHHVGGALGSFVLCFALTERERQAHCVIDSRRMRASCEGKAPMAPRKPRAGSFERGRRPGRIATIRVPNVPPAGRAESPSRSSTDVLAELFSPSHRTDAL